MAEIFVGTKHGEFGVEEWSEQIGRFPQHSGRAITSALKSEGNRLRNIIKLSIQRGGSEEGWPKLHPHTIPLYSAKRREKRRGQRMSRGVKVRARKYAEHIEQQSSKFPLQRLAGAVRYYYDNTIKTITIGFLDQKKRGLAKLHAGGFRIPVTDKMRKMAFAAGFPLAKNTKELNVPARPVVGPVFMREKTNIVRNVQEKSLRNIYRYLTGKTKEKMDEGWPV